MRLVPKKEAHWRLGVSRATLDRWRGLPGKPKAVIQGVRVFYKDAELDDYISKLPSPVGKAHK